jgi:ribonuclease HI
MQALSLTGEAVDSLEALAEQLNLSDFDLLLVGDGSGTVYHQPAGWACVSYDRTLREAYVHTGAVSCGTNNFAELAPFVQALWYHHQAIHPLTSDPLRVTIISDSEVTVRCGNRQYARNANGSLWAAIAWFEEHGFDLNWRHIPRNSNAWAAWVDFVAKTGRCTMEELLQLLPAPPPSPLVSV